MKRCIPLILLCLAGVVTCWSLDRNAFTVTNYRLQVQIDRPTQVMAVNGRLVLRNDSKLPQKNVALQISSSLQWNVIGTDDEPLNCQCFATPKHSLQWLGDPYTSDIDHTGSLSEAIVTLPHDVPPGGSVALDVQYGGTIAANATRLTRVGVPNAIALRNDWDQISEPFTAVRGFGHVIWYPVALEAVSISEGNSVLDAIAAWKERHRNTEFFVNLGVATGSDAQKPCIVSNTASGQGYWEVGGGAAAAATATGTAGADAQTSSSAAGRERELRGITLQTRGLQTILPTFVILSTCDTLSRPSVNITFTPEHSLIAKDYAAAAESGEQLLSDWLSPTSTKPTRIIELTSPDVNPFQDGATLFTPLLSSTPQNLQLLLLPTQVAARFPGARPWMQDGLGLFMQALASRERGGRDAALKFIDQYEAPLVKAEELAHPAKSAKANPPPASESDNTLLNTSDQLYLRVKGGFVFWMLREMLGDTILQHALTAYHADADRDPTYFQKLLEAQSKHDLEWFFDDWVYRDRGLPEFHVQSAFSRTLLAGTANSYLVTVTIENRGSAGAEVPVVFQTAAGDRSVRVVVKAHDKGVARIDLPDLPTRVVVNDGSVPESDTSNNTYEFPAKSQP